MAEQSFRTMSLLSKVRREKPSRSRKSALSSKLSNEDDDLHDELHDDDIFDNDGFDEIGSQTTLTTGPVNKPNPRESWACPFFLLDPVKFVACGRGHFSPIRIHSHIHRRHLLQPELSCTKCRTEHSTKADILAHVKAAYCEPRTLKDGKLTPEEWERIFASGRLRNRTALERYNLMWQLLFPGEPLPKSTLHSHDDFIYIPGSRHYSVTVVALNTLIQLGVIAKVNDSTTDHASRPTSSLLTASIPKDVWESAQNADLIDIPVAYNRFIPETAYDLFDLPDHTTHNTIHNLSDLPDNTTHDTIHDPSYSNISSQPWSQPLADSEVGRSMLGESSVSKMAFNGNIAEKRYEQSTLRGHSSTPGSSDELDSNDSFDPLMDNSDDDTEFHQAIPLRVRVIFLLRLLLEVEKFDGGRHIRNHTNTTNSTAKNTQTITNTTNIERRERIGKRSRPMGYSDEGDESNKRRRDDDTPTSSSALDGAMHDDKRLFACPFHKWKPLQFVNCQRKVLRAVNRVKQHLKRYHPVQIYCSVCYAVFDQEIQRDEHVRQRFCQEQPEQSLDGMTIERAFVLQSKSSSKLSPKQQWHNIFRILFPSSSLPESPYLEGTTSKILEKVSTVIGTSWQPVYDSLVAEHIPSEYHENEVVMRPFFTSLAHRTISVIFIQHENSFRHVSSNHSESGYASQVAVRAATPVRNAAAGLTDLGSQSHSDDSEATLEAPTLQNPLNLLSTNLVVPVHSNIQAHGTGTTSTQSLMAALGEEELLTALAGMNGEEWLLHYGDLLDLPDNNTDVEQELP